jgi:hypothetical protein
MIEWKDRAHATASPERPTQVVAPPAPDPDPTPEVLEAQLEAERIEDRDGLDPSTLDEVDESSIPEPAR